MKSFGIKGVKMKKIILLICIGMCGILGYIGYKKDIFGKLYALYLIKSNIDLACPFSVKGGVIDSSRLIAHAGGGLLGDSYTNSLEALNASIANGYKFIELDLLLSSDRVIYAAHDEAHFNAITGFKELRDTKPSLNEVRKRKILNKYSTLDIDKIREIFLKHKDLILVTDKLNDFNALREQIPFKDRLIVEVFDAPKSLKNYNLALESGIKYPALSSADFLFAIRNKIPLLAMNTKNLSSPFAKEYIKLNGCILAFSSNEEKFIKDNLANATLFYSDFWDLKKGKCMNKTCKTY